MITSNNIHRGTGIRGSITSDLIDLLNYPMTLSQEGGAILMYHVVGQRYPDGQILRRETFRRHLKYLSSEANVVDIPQLYQGEDTPENKIVLTFDGGYKDFYHVVLPLLRKYEFPATVFVPSERIGMENEKTDNTSLWVDWFDFMTEEEIEELVEDPLITIGNKTLTHRFPLPELSPEECKWEVFEGKRQLEDRFGINIDRFCFPCGEFDEYSLKTVGEIHDYAVTTQPNFVNRESNPCLLPRFTADFIDARTLKNRLTNRYVFENNFRRYLKNVFDK